MFACSPFMPVWTGPDKDGPEDDSQPKYHIQPEAMYSRAHSFDRSLRSGRICLLRPRSRLLYDISYERSMPEPPVPYLSDLNVHMPVSVRVSSVSTLFWKHLCTIDLIVPRPC